MCINTGSIFLSNFDARCEFHGWKWVENTVIQNLNYSRASRLVPMLLSETMSHFWRFCFRRQMPIYMVSTSLIYKWTIFLAICHCHLTSETKLPKKGIWCYSAASKGVRTDINYLEEITFLWIKTFSVHFCTRNSNLPSDFIFHIMKKFGD
jgi:hypothetical protein